MNEKTLKALEFDKILYKLASFAKLKQSKTLCLELLPLDETAQIQIQLNYTNEAKAFLDKAIELPIEFVANIENIKNSTINSYLSEQEIIDVAKTIRTSRLVKNTIKQNCEDASQLFELSSNLFSDKEFEEYIFSIFDSNLNIKKDATAELKSLFSSLQDSEKNLKTRVNELLNSPSFSKYLQEQIYTMRDDRVVFQVRASSKSKVEGIVHDVSSSNQTFYIEPKQLVSLNNKLRELKSKISAEIIKILSELTRIIREKIDEIKFCEEILTEIDFHFTKARYAISIKAIEPELIEEKQIKIDNMRHPILIESVKTVVENDFEIGSNYKSIVITGSNTGGKTVVIKTIGLFLLMAKSGLFLPCNEAKIFPFRKIFADIGDEQSITQSLSTFSSHMTNIIDIVNNADEDTFIVLDEMCAGTDPQEGAILAEVILEDLAKKGATSCITTHYGELKALEFSNNYFKNASVEFDTQSLKPTYKLVIGIPGLSNAILISSNLGLPQELVEKAKNVLVSQKDPSIVVVEKLQETQQSLSENLKQAQELKESSSELQKDYEEKLSTLKKEKKKAIKVIKDRFDNQITTAKEEIKEILNQMRKEKSEKIARRSYSRLAKLEKTMRDDLSTFDEKEEYDEIDWQYVKIGQKVLLKELNQPVELLSLPDKNGNIQIKMGLINTRIKIEKLAFYDSQKVSMPKLKYKVQPTFEIERHNTSNTLDLRGYRVEEALDALEYYLDKASLINLTPVYIIHGHGTGALKSSIRDFIHDSPYVAKHRVGEASEGGDGVSVIDIN